ncbi:MAG: hypothetical protein MJ062_02840 [Oscillospiraceae bacterium]|nr:hypothetical protein [Oscillospiraceae bacterium]
MAGKQYQDDIPMDDYYENGMLRGEPEEPKQHKSKSRIPSGRTKKRAAAGKRLLIAVVGLTALALIVSLIVFIGKRRNDGARFAEKLSLCIGSTLQDAHKNLKNIELYSQSDYAPIDNLLQPFSACTTSKKEAVVQGVRVPEWNIICRADDDVLNEVWYYDYTVLESTPYGTKRKAYLDPNQVSTDTTIEQFEESIGLKPYCIHYAADHSQTREYRYCFEDAETKNLTAYIISATWNGSGGMLDHSDRRVDFLTSLLRTSLE